MNALVRKEVRAILPAWGVAMVLATLPVWIVWPGQNGVMFQGLGLMVFVPFGLGVLLLSITPFGQELSWGTFSVLLAQPVARQRLWTVKTAVLGAALACTLAALCISNFIRVDSMLDSMKHTTWRNAFGQPGENTRFFLRIIQGARQSASRDSLVIGGLAVLAGFGGGLWTTLLFRHVAAAFWLTCLVPIGLVLLTGKVLADFPESVVQSGLFVVLAAYSAAGFVWAKRMFFRLQDAQWTGGVITLPQWGRVTARTSAGEGAGGRDRKPIRALLRKEIQAQQVNMLLAAGLFVIHSAVVLLRRVSAQYLASHQSVAMPLEEFPRLWLVMPLLVGSVAFAEERKLGTLGSSLCLPVTRRMQFVLKIAVALVLGVVFGGVMPLAVEYLAGAAGVRGNFSGLFFLGETRSIMPLQLAGAIGLTGLALYGSTLTRNSLQAMGAGLMTSVIACMVIFAAGNAGADGEIFLWKGALIKWIAWPVMVFITVRLVYRNFGHLQPDGRTWLRNVLTLFVALAGVALMTTVIYHRAWEAWLPEEPSHGLGPSIYPNTVTRGRDTFNQQHSLLPNVRASSFRQAALLPDGRLWLSQRQVRLRESRIKDQGTVRRYETGPRHSGFVAGSTWSGIAVADLGTFGIQTDGSLWDLSKLQGAEFSPKRIGQGQDWQTISAGGDHFCALKSDGTLWQWGTQAKPGVSRLSLQNSEIPEQVGGDNDWVAICNSWRASAATKADGSIWTWGENWRINANGSRSYHRDRQPVRWLAGPCNRPRSISLSSSGQVIATVCEDGTLWIGGDLTNSSYMRLVAPGEARAAASEMVPWGNDRDWTEIQFVGWAKAIGLKKDGSLWEWTLVWNGPWEGWLIPPTMPSRYMDWICVCSEDNAFLALARDGSLCLWGDPEDGRYYDGNGQERRLLMPSRIKARRVTDLLR